MTTIKKALTESVANLGISESLLIFTTDGTEFIRFDATANGLIDLSADSGDIQVTMQRVHIQQVVSDFELADRFTELPLKTVLLNAEGTFQVDDEAIAVLGADSEGIPSRHEVPLIERIKAVIVQCIPALRNESASSITSEDNTIMADFMEDYLIEITHSDDESRVRVSVIAQDVQTSIALRYAREHIETVDFGLVKIKVIAEFSEDKSLCAMVFEVVLPSIPFLGQHFMDAMNDLTKHVHNWNNYVDRGYS